MDVEVAGGEEGRDKGKGWIGRGADGEEGRGRMRMKGGGGWG